MEVEDGGESVRARSGGRAVLPALHRAAGSGARPTPQHPDL